MSIESSTHTHVQFERTLGSAAETQALGRTLGDLLHAHFAESTEHGALVIALHGDLGAGKTTLTQGIAAGLGIRERVTSPTFTLINEYETSNGVRLFHVDGYRLGGVEAETSADEGTEAAAMQAAEIEAGAMGLDELLAEDAVVVVEWAERVAALLPTDHLSITLSYAETAETAETSAEARHMVCRAAGTEATAPHSTAMVQALARALA